ncbi:hypothetical protein J3459_006295 [Metarhizium acridum]|nr:hypothetical protein J3459_006295 [Metarhizium acridum]
MNEAVFSTDKLKPEDLRIDPSAPASQRFSSRMVESPYGSPLEAPGLTVRPGTAHDDLILEEDIVPLRLKIAITTPAGFRNDHGPMETTSPQRQHTWERQDMPNRLALPSRGDCKPYHKACFVCTTCTEPFSSSVFYVLDDKPYCEQHYHELNGSLCGDCGRGIEGQYLEDEARVKYHVGCFRCLDCGGISVGRILRGLTATLIVSEMRGNVYNQRCLQSQSHINADHPVVPLALELHKDSLHVQHLVLVKEEDLIHLRPTVFRMEDVSGSVQVNSSE